MTNLFGSRLKDPWFFEALFDRLPHVVFFVKDREGRYIIVNDTLVKRLGATSKATLLGKKAEEVFPAPLGEAFTAQDSSVLNGHEEIRDQLELHLYPDGTRGWCMTDKFALRDEAGEVVAMAGMSRDLNEPDREGSAIRAVASVVDHMRGHYGDTLQVGDLAAAAGMTVARLERNVRRVYGVTPSQLLSQIRLDAAAQMLAGTDTSVGEIAVHCGYADHSAFTRQFRSTVGVTPSQFRASARRTAQSSDDEPAGPTTRLLGS